jgi:hypothetical protein
MPGDYWFRAGYDKKDTGPRHGCGRKDRKDTANWPIYEPHAWGTKYRHWGAGRLVYKPDLSTDHYTDAVVSQRNVAPGKKGVACLQTEKPAETAELVLSVGCPYVITAGELSLVRRGGNSPGVAVSVDRGTTWKPVELKGEGDELKALFVDEVNGAFDGYWLQIRLPPGGGIADLELTSHFQLNPYSLPHLVPGKNVVSVDAKAYGSPLTVTYNWSESEGWQTAKTAGATLSKDGSFEIQVAGPKYPRMKSLVLSVAP